MRRRGRSWLDDLLCDVQDLVRAASVRGEEWSPDDGDFWWSRDDPAWDRYPELWPRDAWGKRCYR